MDLIVSQNAPIRWITALVVFCLSMIVFGAFSILHAGRSGVLSARKFAVRVVNTYDGAAGRELQRVERSYEGLNSVGQSLAVPIELNLEQTPSAGRVQERAALLGQQVKEMASATANGQPESPQVASALLAQAAMMMQSLQISDGPEIVEQPAAAHRFYAMGVARGLSPGRVRHRLEPRVQGGGALGATEQHGPSRLGLGGLDGPSVAPLGSAGLRMQEASMVGTGR